MCEQIAECEPEIAEQAFFAHDPIDSQLGSGAGTAFLLHEAWLRSNQQSSSTETFGDWIGKRQRICLLYTSPSPRDQRGSRMPSSA